MTSTNEPTDYEFRTSVKFRDNRTAKWSKTYDYKTTEQVPPDTWILVNVGGFPATARVTQSYKTNPEALVSLKPVLQLLGKF